MSNGWNANHVTLPAVCDHAALRPRCLFRSSAFGPVGVTAVPDSMHARMFTQMCKMRRRRGRGPAAACSLYGDVYVKGERRGRGREDACCRSLYEVAGLTVGLRCIVLLDNLFLTDTKWLHSTCYAKPKWREARLWLVRTYVE